MIFFLPIIKVEEGMCVISTKEVDFMNAVKLIASMAIVISLLIVGTLAAFSDQDKIVNTKAVQMNVTLKIMQGRDDGTFDPQGQVTRAEMAKIISLILNGGNEPTRSSKETTSLTDIQGHWAESYIMYCTDLGVVSGSGDGTFNPDGKVTSTQAAKMLLVALGYDAEQEQFNSSNWFLKINAIANQKELYDELTIDPNAFLSRDEAAQMIWNALNACEVAYEDKEINANGLTSNTTVREDKQGNLLKSKFNTDGELQGMLTSYHWNEREKCFTYEIQDQGTFKSKEDFTKQFGLNMKVVYQNDADMTLYGMYLSNSNILATGIAGDLKIADTANEIQFHNVNYMIDYAISGETPSPEDALNALPTYAENHGDTMETYEEASLALHKPYEVRLIDQDGDGKVDYLIYLPFTIGQVSAVGVKNVTVKDLKEFDSNPDQDPDQGADQTVMVIPSNNDDRIYDGIAKDDYVKIIPQEYTAYQSHEVIPLKAVEAMVTDMKDDMIQVNDMWYYNATGLAVEKDRTYVFHADEASLYYCEELSA
jgi:predicted ribosomally synthesized peptide with SipW-like signal peptide